MPNSQSEQQFAMSFLYTCGTKYLKYPVHFDDCDTELVVHVARSEYRLYFGRGKFKFGGDGRYGTVTMNTMLETLTGFVYI